MLDYLKDKKDVGFFQGLAGLMQSCRYWPRSTFSFSPCETPPHL